MGAQAWGVRLGLDDVEVRYSYAPELDPPQGVLVIPLADPDASYAEGRDALPHAAQRVLWKALRVHRQTGTWPERVAFQS